MERRIVSMTPHASGWRIETPEGAVNVMGDVGAAISEPGRLAMEVHCSTGFPTAVKVRLGCGDGVMMGYHG